MSVVLPVLNEARDIGRLLGEILDQAPPPGGFEVLVADGGSTDATRDIVTQLSGRWPNLKLLDNPRRLSSAGRNVGARAAKGKYVLFLDGHCSIPRRDYLMRMVELFESTGAACLCRPQPLNRMTEGKWAAAISAARHSRLGHNPGSDIYGGEPGFTSPESAGAAYLRTVIEELGGYDERFDACEDVEFNHRVALAGLPAYRHPDLAVEYRPRDTLRGLFRQMMRYGRGRARLMARHPRMVPWPLVLITAYSLSTVLILVFGGFRPAIPVVAVPLGAWMLVVTAESLRVSCHATKAMRSVLALFSIHGGLVLGFWRGMLEWRSFRARAPQTTSPESPDPGVPDGQCSKDPL